MHPLFDLRLDRSERLLLAQKSLVAVSDQGVFALANFAVWILLARWMQEESYGAFSVVFSIFLLSAGFHNVVLREPMIIFGSARHREYFLGYLRQLLTLHVFGALAIGVVLLGISGCMAILTPRSPLLGAFAGMGIGYGLTLGFWLMREACYVKHRTEIALVGTAVYAVILVSGVFVIHLVDKLTPFTGFVWFGTAGLLAAIVVFVLLMNASSSAEKNSPLTLLDVTKENWQYGRWLIPASMSNWLSLWAFFVLVGGLLSLEEVGGLKAIHNITIPLTQVMTALGRLFVPWASLKFEQHGMALLKSSMAFFMGIMAIVSIVYSTLVFVFRAPVVSMLYGGKYDAFEWLLGYLLLMGTVAALTTSWSYGLKIVGRTRDVLTLEMISAVTTLTIGIFLVRSWGLRGAAVGIVLSCIAPLPIMARIWMVRGRIK